MPPADTFAQLTAFARAVAPTLDQKNYYELLNVAPAANIPDIRLAYYKIAGQLHPDRYVNLPDRDAKEKLETIYTRITEGYRVLTDPKRRQGYDEVLDKGQKRFVTTSRERKGPQNPEDGLKHPEAKKFFRMGLVAMESRDFKGAALNFNLARAYEPSAQIIAAKHAEAKARLDEVTAVAAAARAAAKSKPPGPPK